MGSVYTIGPATSTRVVRHTLRRVTKREPCPICDHTHYCEIRDDGAVHCMRVESEIPSNRGAGWWHRFPNEHSNAHTPVRTVHTTATKSVAPMASADERHRVYSDLLGACQISAVHEAWLIGQGIPSDQLDSYGTLNGSRGNVAKYLQQRYSNDLLMRIPGLFAHDDGTIGIASADGLLLAVRDTTGRIVRLQSRCETSDGKVYRWLSSSSHGGPTSGALPHYAAAPDRRWLWITEGVKKSVIAAARTGQHAMGLPGHAAITAGLAMLDQLIADGLPGVIIALDEDADPATAALVDTSRHAWIAACLERGLAVRVARWDNADGKGIDDLLLTSHKPLIETAKPVGEFHQPGSTDPGSVDRGVRLTRDQKAARYDQLDNLFWCRDLTDPENPKKAMLLSQKATLWASWRFGGFPGEAPAAEARRVPAAVMGDCLGLSDNTLRSNLKSLDKAGLIDYHHSRKSEIRNDVMIQARRPLGRNEVVAKPERTEKARKTATVRRCQSCGVGEIHQQSKTRSVCDHCGEVRNETAWQDISPEANSKCAVSDQRGGKHDHRAAGSGRRSAARDMESTEPAMAGNASGFQTPVHAKSAVRRDAETVAPAYGEQAGDLGVGESLAGDNGGATLSREAAGASNNRIEGFSVRDTVSAGRCATAVDSCSVSDLESDLSSGSWREPCEDGSDQPGVRGAVLGQADDEARSVAHHVYDIGPETAADRDPWTCACGCRVWKHSHSNGAPDEPLCCDKCGAVFRR